MVSQAEPRSLLRRRSLVEIHAAVFLFGFPGLFGKWLPIPPYLIVAGRVFFAAAALGLVLALRRQSFRVSPFRDLRLLVICGLVLAVHWTLFFKSIQVSTVAVGLLSYSSFPVFTAFLEPLYFREKWDPWSLALGLLTVLGVFLIVPRSGLSNPVFQGVLWGLGAGLTFSFLSLVNRDLAGRLPSLTIAFYQDLVALVLLLPFVILAGFRPDGRTIGLLALLGIVSTAAAHTLFINGMKRVRARTASIISSLEPVYGIVLALVFLKESPSLETLSGGALILAAALAATARDSRIF
jgi:drug/metabolite transporter (DMT)-like permease